MREKILRFLSKEVNDLITEYDNVVLSGGSLRDIYLGKSPKDFDIFVCAEKNIWEEFSQRLSDLLSVKEKNIVISNIGTVNKISNFDVIHSDFINSKFVNETFDFTINMLMWDGRNLIGTSNYSVTEIQDHIKDKKLIVGNSALMFSTFERLIIRFDKFINQGYTIDEVNKKKLASILEVLNIIGKKWVYEITFR